MNNESFEEFETEIIDQELGNVESFDEFLQRIRAYVNTNKEIFKDKINEIIEKNNYSKSDFADIIGVSRQTVSSWCSKDGGVPDKKEHYIKIGLAAKYNIEEMSQFLKKCGGFSGLYSKELNDCICMYVINNIDENERIKKYVYIQEKILNNIVSKKGEAVNLTTLKFDDMLMNVDSEENLEKFINENTDIFLSAYNKFYAIAQHNINDSREREVVDTIEKLADNLNWTSSLRGCVSQIMNKKWYPSRNKIISLGLHLFLDREQIDDMLSAANMEKLWPRNLFDSIIIYAVEEATVESFYDPVETCKNVAKYLSSLGIADFIPFINDVTVLDEEDDY